MFCSICLLLLLMVLFYSFDQAMSLLVCCLQLFFHVLVCFVLFFLFMVLLLFDICVFVLTKTIGMSMCKELRLATGDQNHYDDIKD